MSDITDTANARHLLAKEVAKRRLESFEYCRTAASEHRRERRSVDVPEGRTYAVESAYLLGDDPANEAVIVVSVAVEGDSTNVAEVIHKTIDERGHAI